MTYTFELPAKLFRYAEDYSTHSEDSPITMALLEPVDPEMRDWMVKHRKHITLRPVGSAARLEVRGAFRATLTHVEIIFTDETAAAMFKLRWGAES